jgi:hypothetical protein
VELLDFLKQTQREVRSDLASDDKLGGGGSFPELIFTDIVTSHMADVGMTFEPTVCHYNAKVGNGTLRISGFSCSEDYTEIDFYISLYDGVDEILSVTDGETKKAAEQCIRFLKMCVEGRLSDKMDKSSDAYELVLILEENYSMFDQIRIYVLTDRRAKTRQFQSRDIQGKTIKLEVMDIERLYNHWQEGRPRDELIVNFEDVIGSSLPCVWVPNQMGEYDYAMTAIPGEALRFLYEKYGPRILEANVRSFLSQTGKVNKGVRDTLRDQPERFMAYNNGIVIIADEVSFSKNESGMPGISWLKGLQIVNGGQTTASLYFTKKKFPKTNLSQVRVPAKIIILRKTDDVEEEALISDISKYANSQNAVRQSDLSANKPFHVSVEKMAEITYCPDGVGRWFYERAAGSYKVMLEREGKTPAGIRKLKVDIPSYRKITKTDLAKYITAWKQRPDIVSFGGQKNFIAFMELIAMEGEDSSEWLDAVKFKNIIAQVIIFKAAQKLIRKEYPAFQANITAYTVAIFSKKLGSKIDLQLIWRNQEVSSELLNQLLTWSREVQESLFTTSNGRMVSEWSKKNECWEILSNHEFTSVRFDIPEFIGGLAI